ncbi:MAG: AarF/ABC1/UbiB kinase family protein [Deltaproteobacteria bacterium]|nr:AarF/ABC1/UbiB kinase family protein [Deltaproteobacteria bacterium]
MSRHGFAPALRLIPVVKHLVPSGNNDASRNHPGERFATMLEELGPSFVKLGQILSTRADLLPREFTDALARLQDQVPPFPSDEAMKVIEAELGEPIGDVFASFDETPLASASMAQVHAAVLKNGDEVVLKVLRPGIEAQVRSDASILVILAQLLELVIEEAAHYRVGDLAEEFEESLTLELDFQHEAKNLQAFAGFNRDREGIYVPKTYPKLSTKHILTMERIYGRRITELVDDDKERVNVIVDRLVMVNFEQVFVDGLFHGDPHPGNVLVDDDDNICFIDFGLVGRVARDTQDRMLLLMVALSLRDADTLSRLLVHLGDAPGRISLAEFRDSIRRLLDRYLGLSVQEVNSSAALADLVELSTKFGIRMPREFALLSKASVAIEGVVRTLYPELDPSQKLSARSEELLLERLDPRELKGGGLRSALQLGMLANDLPLQLTQVLMDVERGHIEFSVRSPQLDGLDREIRGLGMTIFGGLTSSSLLLGGIYVLARYDWHLYGVPVLPPILFAIATGHFAIAFAWFLTGGKMPRFGVGRIFGWVRKLRQRRGRKT